MTAHQCTSIKQFVIVTADMVIARYELQLPSKHNAFKLIKQAALTNQQFCSDGRASSWEKEAPEKLIAPLPKGTCAQTTAGLDFCGEGCSGVKQRGYSYLFLCQALREMGVLLDQSHPTQKPHRLTGKVYPISFPHTEGIRC